MRKVLCFIGSVITLMIALLLAVVMAVFDVLNELSKTIATGVGTMGFRLCELSDKWIDEVTADE
jgi:hypothetical protein